MANHLFTDTAIIRDRYLLNYWNGNISVRSQRFRLDNHEALFDIVNDREQEQNVRDDYPEKYKELLDAKEEFQKEVISELPVEDKRLFPLGHPGLKYTQIPARDGVAHGNIVHSLPTG